MSQYCPLALKFWWIRLVALNLSYTITHIIDVQYVCVNLNGHFSHVWRHQSSLVVTFTYVITLHKLNMENNV